MAPTRIRLTGLYRLITRSDFDGLVSGMLLQEAGFVDRVLFAHPKDMQDGTVEVGSRDIIAGLPFVAGCAIAFDNSPGEASSVAEHVRDARHASVARLVYTWLGGRLAFPRIDQAMLGVVDKTQTAQFSAEEIIDPQGWALLAFLMDARTGLGRFREFRLSNYQLMLELIPYCRRHTIEEILEHPDVAERVQLYREHQGKCQEQIRSKARLQGHVVVLDLREEEVIWAGNRFLVYALFPQAQVSVHVMWGLRRQNTVLAVGRSIVNPSAQLEIGCLMEQFGGGGHSHAGSCQVPHDQAEEVLSAIVTAVG